MRAIGIRTDSGCDEGIQEPIQPNNKDGTLAGLQSRLEPVRLSSFSRTIPHPVGRMPYGVVVCQRNCLREQRGRLRATPETANAEYPGIGALSLGLCVARHGNRESPADIRHGGGRDATHPLDQAGATHELDIIQIDDGLEPYPTGRTDRDLRREPPDGRRDRRRDHRMEQGSQGIAREYDYRTHFVEPGEPDLGASRNGISHVSSAYRASQSVSSSGAESASSAISFSARVGGTRW